MSFCDLCRYIQGYQIRDSHEWARVRRASFFIAQGYSKQRVNERKLFPLPTDPAPKKVKAEKLTVQDYEALLKRYGKKHG